MTHPKLSLTKFSNSKRTVVSLVAVAAFSLGAMPAANAMTNNTASDSGRIGATTQTDAGVSGEWHGNRYDMGSMHHDGLQGSNWRSNSSSGSLGVDLGLSADADYQRSDNDNHTANSSSGSLGADVNAGVQASGQSSNNTHEASSSEGNAQAAVGVDANVQGDSHTSDSGNSENHHQSSNSGSLNTGLNLGLNLGGSSSNRGGGLLGL